MPLEIEVKFPVRNFKDIRSALSRAGAGLKENIFEKNIVYDTPGEELKGRSALLRIRQTGKYCLLTLKQQPEKVQDTGMKSRMENQVLVSDFSEADNILKGLGYLPVLCYEKFRQVYALENAEICLDTVSFGRFVEIEAHENIVLDLAESLGLDLNEKTAASYHRLNREYNLANGLKPNTSFVFTPEQRTSLAQKFNCDISWLSAT